MRKLDKTALTNWKNLDPAVLKTISDSGTDPDNVYAMPYIQGYTSFIYNEDMVKKIMPDAPVDSLRMLFDPAVGGKAQGLRHQLRRFAGGRGPAGPALQRQEPEHPGPRRHQGGLRHLEQGPRHRAHGGFRPTT